MPLGVLVSGVLVLGLLLAARWLHLRTEVEDAAWVQAVGTIEADVAISHLWLEEYVSGDEVDLEEIDARLDRAGRLVEALLGESHSAEADTRVGRRALRPLRDEAELATMRQEVLRLGESLDQFRQIAEDRRLGLERGLPVGIGSSFDVEYDAVFARLLGHVQVLKATLVESRETSRRREARGAWIFGAAWMALIAIASAGLWERERRRRQAELALEEHQRQLWRVQRTEAVGRLAGGLAHDLGNYLAAIRAQCELLLRKTTKVDSVPSELTRTKMTTTLGVVDKAAALLDRLLSFHRGARIEQLETVDLNATLQDLEPMIASALGRDIELRLDLAPDLWPVAADPLGLEQAVINLAVNAKDAMQDRRKDCVPETNAVADPAGGAAPGAAGILGACRLTLETSNEPAAGVDGADQVRLTVSDTGVGIPPEVLERVFDPFWSTKGDSGHSGLGLAIVDSVVHQMGGTVSVTSRPGRGTAFRIELPRV